MELSNISRVFFVGIGGIGMSAIARYFAFKGAIVCGYDKTRTALCQKLEQEGMLISYLDQVSSIPVSFHEADQNTLVVYTPAIPKDSQLLNHFKNNGFSVKKRAEVLGIISRDSFCIAVAGTHGKTTTSALVAHILTHTGYGCNAFLGGILSNYDSNFLFHENNVVVVEADEYDRSFLTLSPDISIITSMDADHLDIYGHAESLTQTFQEFAAKLKEGGLLLKKDQLPLEGGESYSALSPATHRAERITAIEGAFAFDYVDSKHTISDLRLKLPGNHNVENAVAAISVALHLGITPEKIRAAIADFKGVKRRFEIVLDTEQHVLIDDYAHHPEELRACFNAVRMLYPNSKMTVVFQPHLFTRTRDFATEFAEVLSQPDHVILLDIYPARELPIEGIDSQFLLDKITLEDKERVSLENLESRIAELLPELVVMVGAGNIDTKVEPIKQLLKNA